MTRLALAILPACVALAACQSTDRADGTHMEQQERADLASGPAALYDNTTWTLTSLRGTGVPTGAHVTISFDQEGRATGRSGVNQYFSQTSAGPENRLTFGIVGATRMAGPEPAMERERDLFQTLADARRFRLTDDTLELLDASGAVIARFRRQSQAPGT